MIDASFEAILYMLENCCKRRSLPEQFGNWATIYKRFRRWVESDVFQKVMEAHQNELFEDVDISTFSLDSTVVKVSPNAAGALKKGSQAIGGTKRVVATKINVVVADSTSVVAFRLTSDNVGDGSKVRETFDSIVFSRFKNSHILMVRAYKGDEAREKACLAGFVPVVPPKKNREEPWEYDKELYKRRNEVERFFRRIKEFRHIMTRFDKLDVVFSAFLSFLFVYLLLEG